MPTSSFYSRNPTPSESESLEAILAQLEAGTALAETKATEAASSASSAASSASSAASSAADAAASLAGLGTDAAQAAASAADAATSATLAQGHASNASSSASAAATSESSASSSASAAATSETNAANSASTASTDATNAANSASAAASSASGASSSASTASTSATNAASSASTASTAATTATTKASEAATSASTATTKASEASTSASAAAASQTAAGTSASNAASSASAASTSATNAANSASAAAASAASVVSVPAGGTTGQALIKNSNTNHDIGWGTVSGGGGGGGREMLTANRTYYVRTDGNDGNDGLTNTAGGAFRTLQKGFDTIATLDLSTFVVTLKIADGTYTENSLTITSPVSSRYASSYIIEGNTTTYSNVVINSPGAAYSNAASGLFFLETNCQVKGVKVTAGYRGFTAQGACHVQLNGVEFGACGVEHVFSSCGSIIELLGANVISGSAVNHLSANNGGEIWGWLGSTTLVGTPDFSGWAFALAYSHGRMSFGTWGDYNFYGAATGPRFDVDSNSVVNLFGASGNSYFPGSTNGTTQRGGLIA